MVSPAFWCMFFSALRSDCSRDCSLGTGCDLLMERSGTSVAPLIFSNTVLRACTNSLSSKRSKYLGIFERTRNEGMVLQKLGRKVSFGTENNHSGWRQDILRTLPLILGVAALATTLLLGSYLWGLVFRRKKKERDRSVPVPDFSLPAGHKPNTIAVFPEFAKAPTRLSPKLAVQDNNTYFEQSDIEDDYEQVLEEAQLHADATQAEPVYHSPAKKASVESWLAMSPDIRQHNFVNFDFEDVEAAFAMNQGDIFRRQHKPSKSWKRLLFWKRSKKSNEVLFRTNGGIHRSGTTPLHHMFHSSRARATVAPSTPNRDFIPRRSTSGPIYYDGVPRTPNRNTRHFIGSHSASSTPSRDGLYESTYKPLKRQYNNYKSCPSPLYIP